MHRNIRSKRLIRYRFIEKEKQNHSIKRLCRTLEVSENAFYVWGAGRIYLFSKKKQQLADRAKDVFL